MQRQGCSLRNAAGGGQAARIELCTAHAKFQGTGQEPSFQLGLASMGKRVAV